MRKKIKVVVILPFVVMLMRFAEWIVTGNSNHLSIACLWGIIGCLEYEIKLLEEKVNGIIH